jgi:small nuclear ribonucleoprotein (snRNP)-like protein
LFDRRADVLQRYHLNQHGPLHPQMGRPVALTYFMGHSPNRKEAVMKQATQSTLVAVAVFLLFAILFVIPPAAQAKSAVAMEDAKFDTASSIKDNLKTYVGKDVVIHLRSGKSLQGYVKAIGDHLVHLEKLSGRDFYDTLIRIEDITAIEAKFRELK